MIQTFFSGGQNTPNASKNDEAITGFCGVGTSSLGLFAYFGFFQLSKRNMHTLHISASKLTAGESVHDCLFLQPCDERLVWCHMGLAETKKSEHSNEWSML